MNFTVEEQSVRQVDRDEVTRNVENWRLLSHNVDSRLLKAIHDEGEMYFITLEDQQTFFSLIWQEIDASRLLTPFGVPRTLNDVLSRFNSEGHSFESLSNSLDLPRTHHKPEWFKDCVKIDQEFDINKFGWLTVVSANDAERNSTPKGTFYIYDGNHRALILAKRILAGETKYQPIECLYLVPRR